MAIKLEANYSKKIGLPSYSSHQFSVTLTTELTSMDDIQLKTNEVYKLLQQAVDQELQSVGYLPGTNTQNNTVQQSSTKTPQAVDSWKCSDKQMALIQKVVEQNKLNKQTIEDLSVERFGKSVTLLNKMEASGLIDELLEQYGKGNRSKKTTNTPSGGTW